MSNFESIHFEFIKILQPTTATTNDWESNESNKIIGNSQRNQSKDTMLRLLNQRIIGMLLPAISQQIIWNAFTVNGQVCDEPGKCKEMTFTADGDDLDLRCEIEGSCQNAVIKSAGNDMVTGNVIVKCWVGEDQGPQNFGHACQGMEIFKDGGGSDQFTLECGKVDFVGRPRQGCSQMNVYCRSPICTIRERHDVAFKTTKIYGESAKSLRIQLYEGHSRERIINVYCPTTEGSECQISTMTSFGGCSDCSPLQDPERRGHYSSKGPPLDVDIVFHVTCPGRIVVDCTDGSHAGNTLRYSVDGEPLTDIIDPCHNQAAAAAICPTPQPTPSAITAECQTNCECCATEQQCAASDAVCAYEEAQCITVQLSGSPTLGSPTTGSETTGSETDLWFRIAMVLLSLLLCYGALAWLFWMCNRKRKSTDNAIDQRRNVDEKNVYQEESDTSTWDIIYDRRQSHDAFTGQNCDDSSFCPQRNVVGTNICQHEDDTPKCAMERVSNQIREESCFNAGFNRQRTFAQKFAAQDINAEFCSLKKDIDDYLTDKRRSLVNVVRTQPDVGSCGSQIKHQNCAKDTIFEEMQEFIWNEDDQQQSLPRRYACDARFNQKKQKYPVLKTIYDR